jgi:hypothetical protein
MSSSRTSLWRPKGPQPILVGQRLRLLHQQGSVGANALTIAASQQAAYRLLRNLAADVPHGNVDPTDGVGDASAPAQPEGIGMQLLRDALGLHRIFPGI